MNTELDNKNLKIAKKVFKILDSKYKHHAYSKHQETITILNQVITRMRNIEYLKDRILKVGLFYTKPHSEQNPRKIFGRKLKSLHHDTQHYLEAIQRCQVQYLDIISDLKDKLRYQPNIRSIYEDIRELEQDFIVEIEEDKLLVTTKEDIIIEGVNFGQFEIILNFSSFLFKAKAIDPFYDFRENVYFHPHIDSGGNICFGEGLEAIDLAIEEHRLADIFNLIASILRTYNSSDCYMKIEMWDEDAGICSCCETATNEPRECANCEEVTCPHCSLICNSCDHEVCDACATYCRECDITICANCVTECTACQAIICPNCLYVCNNCGKNLCSDCRYVCSCCDEITCEDCYEECEECGDLICEECTEKYSSRHTRMCKKCFDEKNRQLELEVG
jgi:hypothetical protein